MKKTQPAGGILPRAFWKTLVVFLAIFQSLSWAAEQPTSVIPPTQKSQTPIRIPSQETPPPFLTPETTPPPTLSPEMLQKFRSGPNREMLINSLQKNTSTKNILEAAASKANMQVGQLKTRSLIGAPVAPTTEPVTHWGRYCPDIEWQTGVKFTFWGPYRECTDPTTNRPLELARLSAESMKMEAPLSRYQSSDYVVLFSQSAPAEAVFLVHPPKSGAYLITVQAKALYPYLNYDLLSFGRVELHYINEQYEPTQTINLTATTDGTGYVGIINYFYRDINSRAIFRLFIKPGHQWLHVSIHGFTLTLL